MEPVTAHWQESPGPEASKTLDGSSKTRGEKVEKRNREFRANVAMAELVIFVKYFISRRLCVF